jgi:hypothetical protein
VAPGFSLENALHGSHSAGASANASASAGGRETGGNDNQGNEVEEGMEEDMEEDMDEDDDEEGEESEDEDDGLEILMNAPQRSVDFRWAFHKSSIYPLCITITFGKPDFNLDVESFESEFNSWNDDRIL